MITWTITITNVTSGTWPNSRQMNTISSSRVGSTHWMSQTHRCHQHMRSSRKSWAFTQPTRKPKTIKPFIIMRKERNRCQWNRGIPQPDTFLPGEDMPRKSLDIRFTDYPFIRKKDYSLFPVPQRRRVRAVGHPFKGHLKSRLDFFNATRQSGNRTKCHVHSMGYGLRVDV